MLIWRISAWVCGWRWRPTGKVSRMSKQCHRCGATSASEISQHSINVALILRFKRIMSHSGCFILADGLKDVCARRHLDLQRKRIRISARAVTTKVTPAYSKLADDFIGACACVASCFARGHILRECACAFDRSKAVLGLNERLNCALPRRAASSVGNRVVYSAGPMQTRVGAVWQRRVQTSRQRTLLWCVLPGPESRLGSETSPDG